jgi:hypothetical protein
MTPASHVRRRAGLAMTQRPFRVAMIGVVEI